MIEHFLMILFNMVWQIYWPLAMGLMLSSLIRHWLPVEVVVKRLGHTSAKSLSIATVLGMVSSSCSYAAASLSRTLLIKQATLANAMAFLVASTNLIVEMFIVLVALLGWTFFWGEILGGLILIVTAAVLFHFFYPKSVEQQLRSALADVSSEHEHHEHTMTEQAASQHCTHSDNHVEHHSPHEHEHHNHEHHDRHSAEVATPVSIISKLRQSAGYFQMDISMIGKEILIGVVVSSFLISVVPLEGWRALFIDSQTVLPVWLHSVLDVVIGVFVAIIAYVCSVGNLLLAAALWHGGISFGGVIGFILADVLTIPMMRVYEKYYGRQPTKWLVGLLFVAIVFTGLSIDAIFHLSGMTISSSGLRPLIQDGVGWNLTTILNLLFIPLSLGYYWLGKRENQAM